MERKMPEHKMSFKNKLRKFFGKAPKDDIYVSSNEQKRQTTTLIKYSNDFSIDSMTISVLEPSGASMKTEYKKDGAGEEIIRDSNGEITQKTEWNTQGLSTKMTRQDDGSYSEKYFVNGKPYTGEKVLGSYKRRLKPDRIGSTVTYKTSVKLYIDGQPIGPTLTNPSFIKDPEEKKKSAIEERRQKALLDSAKDAIKSGDKAKLGKIIENADKQRELLSSPEFQQLLEKCHQQTKTSAEFTEMLEKGNYMKMQPISKLEAALARQRENIALTKEKSVTETQKTSQKTEQESSLQNKQQATPKPVRTYE